MLYLPLLTFEFKVFLGSSEPLTNISTVVGGRLARFPTDPPGGTFAMVIVE